MEAADPLVHRLFDPVIERSARLGAGLDWKTSLQELTAAEDLGGPEYVVDESGPDHQKSFRAVSRRSAARCWGEGEGRTKKEAEQQAAEAAWTAISARVELGGRRTRCGGARLRRQRGRPGRRSARIRQQPAPGLAGSRTVTVARAARGGDRQGRAAAPCERPHLRRGPGAPPAGGPAAPGRSRRLRRRADRRPLSASPPRGASTCGCPSMTDALLAHLGMSGQLWSASRTARSTPHVRARFSFTDGGPDLRFVDQRTFGHLSFSPGRRRAAGGHRPHRARPAGAGLRRRPVRRPADARRTGIKRALLDQSLISGVGNIYADESLWRAGCTGPGTRTRSAAATCPAARCRPRGIRRGDQRSAARPSTASTCASTARAGTSTGHWPSTAGLGSRARAAARPSGGTSS